MSTHAWKRVGHHGRDVYWRCLVCDARVWTEGPEANRAPTMGTDLSGATCEEYQENLATFKRENQTSISRR
jgi:hypothetical protein